MRAILKKKTEEMSAWDNEKVVYTLFLQKTADGGEINSSQLTAVEVTKENFEQAEMGKTYALGISDWKE